MDKKNQDNFRHEGIRTRLSVALNQNLYTDLYFILGGSDKIVVSSHKLIVQLSSPFFDELITKHESEAGPEGAKSLMIKLDHNICPVLFKRLVKVRPINYLFIILMIYIFTVYLHG